MDLTRRDVLKTLVAGAAAGALAAPLGGASAAQGAGGEAARRIVRFQKGGGPPRYGILESGVRELAASPFESVRPGAETHALSDVKLLVPCEPTKILALAGNYRSHLADQPIPKNPEAFFKPPSALLENEGAIRIPEGTSDVHYEGELVIVIGKRARNVSPAEAPAHIFGYTCGNDVSARDWQKNDRQWWRAKGCDTFAGLGPWIVSGLDVADKLLTTRLNGKEVQRATMKELIFGPAETVSFLSRHVTLEPGDLIYTGTPGTTSAMKSGDVVEVEIEGIGVLRNRVA
jgi:2-keto-4-pentenoate hydratase/2-oxohepta-3-ene-1,7-dioic acid hydratase in catechol pathway